LALTSPTGGGRSVGIVRLRTTATEFSLVFNLVFYFNTSGQGKREILLFIRRSMYMLGTQTVDLEPHDIRGLRVGISDTGPIVPRSDLWIKEKCGIRFEYHRNRLVYFILPLRTVP
jgi:hypothetical protein